jgi:hypothetical protein
MTLTRDEREYVASLVALLRSDRPLDPPLSSPVSLADFMSHKRGLARWDRDAIADIVEYFFRRKDGKKQGRPPDTMFEIFAASSRLVTYHRLVLSELSDGKSYAEAIKNVARREGLKPSSLKRYLRSLKVESRRTRTKNSRCSQNQTSDSSMCALCKMRSTLEKLMTRRCRSSRNGSVLIRPD